MFVSPKFLGTCERKPDTMFDYFLLNKQTKIERMDTKSPTKRLLLSSFIECTVLVISNNLNKGSNIFFEFRTGLTSSRFPIQ